MGGWAQAANGGLACRDGGATAASRLHFGPRCFTAAARRLLLRPPLDPQSRLQLRPLLGALVRPLLRSSQRLCSLSPATARLRLPLRLLCSLAASVRSVRLLRRPCSIRAVVVCLGLCLGGSAGLAAACDDAGVCGTRAPGPGGMAQWVRCGGCGAPSAASHLLPTTLTGAVSKLLRCGVLVSAGQHAGVATHVAGRARHAARVGRSPVPLQEGEMRKAALVAGTSGVRGAAPQGLLLHRRATADAPAARSARRQPRAAGGSARCRPLRSGRTPSRAGNQRRARGLHQWGSRSRGPGHRPCIGWQAGALSEGGRHARRQQAVGTSQLPVTAAPPLSDLCSTCWSRQRSLALVSGHRRKVWRPPCWAVMKTESSMTAGQAQHGAGRHGQQGCGSGRFGGSSGASTQA